MNNTPDNNPLLCLSYPEILQYINKNGFITAENIEPAPIPENDVTLTTEFIRAFLMPADKPLLTCNSGQLHGLVTHWYNIARQIPVTISKGGVILAMCRAGFTVYHSPGTADCFYNIREQDIKEIARAFASNPASPRNEA